MIKFGLKLGLLGIMGAALMGCSDGTAQDGVVTDLEVQSETLPVSLTALAFNADTTCLKKDAGDEVSLTLTDGTQFSIPRSWLLSLNIANAKTEYEITASSFSNVFDAKFNLPWSFKSNGCAETVVGFIHDKDQQVDYNYEGGYGAFDTMFTPVKIFENVPKKVLRQAYSNFDAHQKTFDDIILFQHPTLNPGWENFHGQFKDKYELNDFYTSEQLNRHKAIRVGPGAYFNDPVLGAGIFADENTDVIGYWQHSQPRWQGGNNIMFLHMPIGKSFSVIFRLKTEIEPLQKYYPAPKSGTKQNSEAALENLFFREELGKTIKASKSIYGSREKGGK